MTVRRNQPLPPPTPRHRVVIERDDSKVGCDMPLDGEISHHFHVNNFFTEVLEALGHAYAPRRMVKIGHPDDDAGIIIAANGVRVLNIPRHLVEPYHGCIPLLLYREHIATDMNPPLTPAQRTYYRAHVRPGSANVGLELALQPTMNEDDRVSSYSMAVTNYITTTGGEAIEVRGALYFPEADVSTVGGALARKVRE